MVQIFYKIVLLPSLMIVYTLGNVGTLECGPGLKVSGERCVPCEKGKYNLKKDTSTSCSDCQPHCPFPYAIITKTCTSERDLECDCKDGFERVMYSEQTVCQEKKSTQSPSTSALPTQSRSTSELSGKVRERSQTLFIVVCAMLAISIQKIL